jgi:hypothetical protein
VTFALLVPTLTQEAKGNGVKSASDDGVAKSESSQATTQLDGSLSCESENGDV